MSEVTAQGRAISIARSTIDGEYDPLLAAREIMQLKKWLPSTEPEVWDDLGGIASEVDGLPLGDERQHWSPAALEEKDREAEDYRSQVRDIVCDAMERLIVDLKAT